MTVYLDKGYTRTLIDQSKDSGLLRNQVAYLLATSAWETAHTMKPVREAFWLTENWRKANLRYYPWYGRGFVQLTWETNYKRADTELGLNGALITNPELALDGEIAAKIAIKGMVEGWFTGKKLSNYITLQKSDFVGARRIINGTDRASEIATLARDYDTALTKDGYGRV
jgi:hypothetical protein